MTRKNRCIRFDDDEWNQVTQLAKEAGMTRSHFIRTRALKSLRAPRLRSELDYQAIHQLSRLGNNLNQLTRLMHTGRPEYEDLRQVLRQLKETMKSFD